MTTSFAGIEEFEAQRREDLSRGLESLGRQLPVLLDLMGMGNTRQWFLDSWRPFIGNLGATEAIDIGEEVVLHSQPLQLIDEILHVVGACLEDALGNEPADIRTLEYVLRSTPQILKAREIIPAKESDVQRALHDHLENTFPEYSRDVRLPKGLKNFVPDGAIGPLQVLIEVKFVDSQRELAQIFSGIMEDLSGYGGSKDWTRFYSVIYQTEPFVNETRFDRSLRLSGNAGSWKPIVVVGPGGRSKVPKRRNVEAPSPDLKRKGPTKRST
jgi:hypothetical protein